MAAIPLSPGVVNTDMLHSCMGAAANNCSSVEDWAQDAIACILGLGVKHNGASLTIQGHGGA
jgi:hypothetical protein